LYYYRSQKQFQIYLISFALCFHFVRYIYYLYLLGIDHPYVVDIL